MKHLNLVSRAPARAGVPFDIEFIIDILTAIVVKKGALAS